MSWGILSVPPRPTGRAGRNSQRVPVFNNDGTLWCEKPLPIQADFILRRLFEMAQADPQLGDRQHWKAAYERDYGWLGTALAEHYAGSETNVCTLLGACSPRSPGSPWTTSWRSPTRSADSPTSDARPLISEMRVRADARAARYLEVNGFSSYIASGGGRHFMRPIRHEVYGIPRARVLGSAHRA
jgi:hypothetical protein